MNDHDDPLDRARRDADEAMQRADVDVVAVGTPDELDVLRATMRAIWGPEIVPPRNLLRGLALGGACLVIARRRDEPVGFALGWLGWNDGVHFHSHQVGVTGDHRGGGIGFALKMVQRVVCLENSVDEMRWTFDPLLLANARFNLVRLGAEVVAFHPHCYGERQDAFNTGERTDRLEVSWRLDRPIGGTTVDPSTTDEVIPIPDDYHGLRAADPSAARELRARAGEAFGGLVASGGRVRGLCDLGYVVTHMTSVDAS